MDVWIWPAMSGSGCQTGMIPTTIAIRRTKILEGRTRVFIVSRAAGRGATRKRLLGARIAMH